MYVKIELNENAFAAGSVCMLRNGVFMFIYLKKTVGAVIAAALALHTFAPASSALQTAEPKIITGTYSYSYSDKSGERLTDSFIYRDDSFTRSSFDECDSLITLSAQAAVTSGSTYGGGGNDLMALLSDLEFEDICVNAYYSAETLDNSVAAAVGHKTVTADGTAYTLLAVIPRSSGYEKEWAGNFNVGSGYLHKGFKEARDEILRFMKKYISEHGITGALKVWTAGHSRGAAVSNLLGGFLAGGGAGYFGSNVSISPEDVYCCTFATPRTIKNGASKNEALSVSGARSGEYAACDTPGEAWEYTGGGTINVNDNAFRGIHNYPFSYDLITHLPLEAWGFTYYGQICSLDNNGEIPYESMLGQLEKSYSAMYSAIVGSGDYRGFGKMTFDLPSMSPKPVGPVTGKEGLTAFVKERIAGLAHAVPDGKYTDSGCEEALMAAAGLFGQGNSLSTDTDQTDIGVSITPILMSLLAYASEDLQARGKAADENEAAAAALADLINYFTGGHLDAASSTLDDLIASVAKYITDNEDSAMADGIKSLMDNVPESYKAVMTGVFKNFSKDPDNASMGELLFDYLRACVYGAEAGTKAAASKELSKPQTIRSTLCTVLSVVIAPSITDTFSVIKVLNSGKCSLTDFVGLLITKWKNGKDENGKSVKYDSFSEAADAGFISMTEKLAETSAYADDLNERLNVIKANIPMFRKIIMDLVFYSESGFSAETCITNLSTLIGNAGCIAAAHSNEVYIAWAKARARAGVGNADYKGTHLLIGSGYGEYATIDDAVKFISTRLSAGNNSDSYVIIINDDHTEPKPITLPRADISVVIMTKDNAVLHLGKPTINANCDLVIDICAEASDDTAKTLTVKAAAGRTASIKRLRSGLPLTLTGLRTSDFVLDTGSSLNIASAMLVNIEIARGTVVMLNEARFSPTKLTGEGMLDVYGVSSVMAAEIENVSVTLNQYDKAVGKNSVTLLPKLIVGNARKLSLTVNDQDGDPADIAGKTIMELHSDDHADDIENVIMISNTDGEKKLSAVRYRNKVRAEYIGAVTLEYNGTIREYSTLEKVWQVIAENERKFPGTEYIVELKENVEFPAVSLPTAAGSLRISGNGHSALLRGMGSLAPKYGFTLKNTVITAVGFNGEPSVLRINSSVGNTEIDGLDFNGKSLSIKGGADNTLLLGRCSEIGMISGFGTITVNQPAVIGKKLIASKLELLSEADLRITSGAALRVNKLLTGVSGARITFEDGAAPVVLNGEVQGDKIALVSDKPLDDRVIFRSRADLYGKFDVSGISPSADGENIFDLYRVGSDHYLSIFSIDVNGTRFAVWNDAVASFTDKTKNYTLTLLGDTDIGAYMKLPAKNKYKSLAIDGNGHKLTFTGTSVSLTGNTLLKDITVSSVDKKAGTEVEWLLNKKGYELKKEGNVVLLKCTEN